jgi:predicted metalloprotease with PDZ domain
LPGDIFEACGRVETTELAEFDRGFDPVRTGQNGNVVTGLDPESPGFRAGLRNGMKILKREAGRTGDSRVELVYRVDDNGTERVIRYLPTGKRRLTLQEFKLKPVLDGAAREACTRRLAGT